MLTCFWSLLHVGKNACLLKYMYKFYEPVQNLTVCIKYVLHLVQFNKKILKKIVRVSIFFVNFMYIGEHFVIQKSDPTFKIFPTSISLPKQAAMFFLWRQLLLSSQAFYRILLRNANAILLARPFRNGSFCSVPGQLDWRNGVRIFKEISWGKIRMLLGWYLVTVAF